MGFRRRRMDALAPALRRLQGVRVTVGNGPARAQVIGVGHRHPVAVPVSLTLAARLVAEGTPLHIRRR